MGVEFSTLKSIGQRALRIESDDSPISQVDIHRGRCVDHNDQPVARSGNSEDKPAVLTDIGAVVTDVGNSSILRCNSGALNARIFGWYGQYFLDEFVVFHAC